MKNPWIPFYWGDYLADTTHLTTFEHGCYVQLLGRYYVTGKPLAAIDDDLFCICKANTVQERNSVMKVVGGLFVQKGSVFHHLRADEELKKRAIISKARACAGSKRHNKSTANDEQLQLQPQPQPQPQPLKPKSKAMFVRPTVEDVTTYCNERNNGVDPQQWHDYYATRGWKVKGGGAMVDWKACVRTWERNGVGADGRSLEKDARIAREANVGVWRPS